MVPDLKCRPYPGEKGGRDEGISGTEANEVGFGDWGDALKKRLFLQDSLGLLQAGSYFYTVPSIIYMSYVNHISYEPILLIWQKA